MSDTPLHVKVAEALGWKDCALEPWTAAEDGIGERVVGPPIWWGLPPGESWRRPVPHYDTDWAATGPLIERYEIVVVARRGLRGDMWLAMENRHADGRLGRTYLEAVCNLILALSAAGKLPR